MLKGFFYRTTEEDDVIIVSGKRKKIVGKHFVDLRNLLKQKVTLWTNPL